MLPKSRREQLWEKALKKLNQKFLINAGEDNKASARNGSKVFEEEAVGRRQVIFEW